MSIRNLSAKTAARFLGVSTSLVRRWARERRFGRFDEEFGVWRFSREELEAYDKIRIGRGQQWG